MENIQLFYVNCEDSITKCYETRFSLRSSPNARWDAINQIARIGDESCYGGISMRSYALLCLKKRGREIPVAKIGFDTASFGLLAITKPGLKNKGIHRVAKARNNYFVTIGRNRLELQARTEEEMMGGIWSPGSTYPFVVLRFQREEISFIVST